MVNLEFTLNLTGTVEDFVLREIRISKQKLLQTWRGDGRLRMQVVGPVEQIARRGKGRGEKEVEEGGEGRREEGGGSETPQ